MFMIRCCFSFLTFFLFVRLVPLVWRGVAVGVAVAVTLPLPTLILPSLAHLHPGLVDAEIITCCQYILSCDRVSIGMLSNLWNVIWCIDIVICKNQISNKYFHKKWHSPDQSFPAAAQHSSEMKQRQFWEIFYSALQLYQERCQNDSYQSSGSQSLNPLANGLLAIFNWVIWKMRQWCSVYIKDR